MTTIAKFHFLGFRTGCEGEKLMSKTNSKDGCFGRLESRFELFDCSGDSRRVARAIGDEETVVRFKVGEWGIPW